MKKLMFKERRKGNETIERKKEREKRRRTRTSKQRTKGEKREESGGWGVGEGLDTFLNIKHERNVYQCIH